MQLLVEANPCDMKVYSYHDITLNCTSPRNVTVVELVCTINRQDCELYDPSNGKGVRTIRITSIKMRPKELLYERYKITRSSGSSGNAKMSTTMEFAGSLDIDNGITYTQIEGCDYWLHLV